MKCYITRTGAHLPGPPVENGDIPAFLGELDGEAAVRARVLRMNGIRTRHYALDREQNATDDVYGLATRAVAGCLGGASEEIGYLSAGSTNAPLVGPGLSSILHDRLADAGLVRGGLEINSNSGICTSSAQALVNAARAVACGDHGRALCVGVEQPSNILKSTVIRVPDDRDEHRGELRNSKWFMSVFLRSMLSDGAGAFLLEDRPSGGSVSCRIDWTHSMSFAHRAPLCMTLESRSLLLSQDVGILSEFMRPCVRELMSAALGKRGETLADYSVVLPHLSSFFFKRHMTDVLEEFGGGSEVEHWTNLDTRGNTGAASIFIMLDEYLRSHEPRHGDRLLLFIPESGQFNFVVIGLTAIHPDSTEP